MKGLLRRTFFVKALYFILLHKYITMLNAYFALILHNISYQSLKTKLRYGILYCNS